MISFSIEYFPMGPFNHQRAQPCMVLSAPCEVLSTQLPVIPVGDEGTQPLTRDAQCLIRLDHKGCHTVYTRFEIL